jgi:hypothetical protein
VRGSVFPTARHKLKEEESLMSKKIPIVFVIGLALALVLSACGAAAGNAAFDKLLGHYDAMIKIMRDNKADSDKAMKELNAYQEKNKAELDQLDKDLKDYTEKNPLQAVEFLTKFAKKTEELAQVSAEMTANIKPAN